MIDDELLGQALRAWGFDSQMRMAVEECAELIRAVCHFERAILGSRENVIEEIADVKIMIRQMELIFGADKVQAIVNGKMERLAERLKGS